MGLYDGIKDVAKVMQQADNIELYQKLLDLSAQALDMQAEIMRLREENNELKKIQDIEGDIEYYVDAFITRHSDTKPIKYCAACWVDKRKLFPLQNQGTGYSKCPLCQVRVADTTKWK